MVTVTGSARVGGQTLTASASLTLPSATPSAWPDATNTGVPAGVTLTPYTGLTRITGTTTIDAALITQPITVTASGRLTVTRSRFRTEGYWLVLNDEGGTFTATDCEFDGMGNTSGDSAVAGYNNTLTRCNIHGTVDGMKLGSNDIVQDCYIHDLVLTADSHNDGLQSLGSEGVLIRHNTIIVKDGGTSAILLSTGSGAQRNITIDGNLLGGGAFTVYGGYQSGVDVLSRVSNIRITNNHITTAIFARGGAYGPFTSVDSPVVMSGNVWHDGPKAGQPAS